MYSQRTRKLRIEQLQKRDLLAQLTVTTPLDLGDLNVGDGQCTVSGGLCSLRAAIEESNALPGADVISFDLPGFGVQEIRPNEFGLGPLPSITDAVTIDGYTQSGAFANTNPVGMGLNGAPTIELNGTLLQGGLGNGLMIASNAPGVVIRGLVIQNFPENGILITDTTGGHRVEGNYVGTNFTGTQHEGNGGDGIRIVGSSNNVIGGITPAARNLISGNGTTSIFSDGIDIRDGQQTPADNNQIQGNLIGTDRHGISSLPNADNGVLVMSAGGGGVSGTMIGGSLPGEGNLISGNGGNPFSIGRSGVFLSSTGATLVNTSVVGNRVGTDVDGLVSLANAVDGIRVDGAVQSLVDNNLASGNDRHGVAVTQSLFCSAIDYSEYPPQANCAGGPTTVSANLIGTDRTGNTALPNQDNGVWIFGAPDNVVGGQNVIAANGDHGVEVDGDRGVEGMVEGVRNHISDNLIGIGADGVTVLGNGQHGVALTNSATDNTVQLNTISFNGSEGVSVDGFTNLIDRNSVRTNSGHGIEILDGVANTITANGISGNGELGINLFDSHDLGSGVTPNDAGDPDGGANRLQNFPEVFLIGGANVFAFDIDSEPTTAFRIELFTNSTCDTAGEGEQYLDHVVVSTDHTGFLRPGDKIRAISSLVPADSFITATATNLATGDTSEFSGCQSLNGFVRGQKFNDLNGNGLREANEPGLDNWTIELVEIDNPANRYSFQTQSYDMDGDGQVDPMTESGNFIFASVKPGTYRLSEVPQAGWQQTFPGPPSYSYTITLLPGDLVIRDFGNRMVDGDFDSDGELTLSDIDMLSAAAASNNHDATFDLTSDGLVNLDDVTFWVEDLKQTLMGDANLDNAVDGVDFTIWNAHKFTDNTAWSAGNFSADSRVDGIDFTVWNQHKFETAELNAPATDEEEDRAERDRIRDSIFSLVGCG